MSAEQHHPENNGSKFTVPAILAFALVFSLFVLMAQCHGPFHPEKVTVKEPTPSYH
jgi:hypothetical protein